jgi:hypothetical protein
MQIYSALRQLVAKEISNAPRGIDQNDIRLAIVTPGTSESHPCSPAP